MLGSEYQAGKQVIAYGAEAKRLAFLARIDADLQLAIARCDLFEEQRMSGVGDIPRLASLAESAVIAYGRIAQGAGGRIPPELVSDLDDETRALHSWAMALRDKHVGHSVNALNQTLAIAVISDDGGVRLRDVFAMNLRVVLTDDDMARLRTLSEAVRIALAPHLETARERVIEALSPDPAASLGNPQPQLDLVSRDDFDYEGTRGDVRGMILIPVNLEEQSYGDLDEPDAEANA